MSTQDAQERRNAGGAEMEPLSKIPRTGEATELAPSMGSSFHEGSHKSLQVTPRDPDHQHPSTNVQPLQMNHRCDILIAPQQTVVQNVLHVHEAPETGSPSKEEVKAQNEYLNQRNIAQHNELIQMSQNLETVAWHEQEMSARLVACRDKYERGASRYESEWINARTAMEDGEAVALGKAKAEADRRLHETRASSAHPSLMKPTQQPPS